MATNAEWVLSMVARDEATEVMRKVRREAQQLGQSGDDFRAFSRGAEGASSSLVTLDANSGRVARSVRQLAIPLVSELGPALSQTSLRIVNVVQSAALLGSGLGAVGVAAVGVAAILGGNLLQAWQKNREEMANWHRALQSSDPGFFAERMKTLTTSLLDAGKAFEDSRRRLEAVAPPQAAPGRDPRDAGVARPPGAVPPGSAAGRLAELDTESLQKEWIRLNDEFKRARAEWELRKGGIEETEALAASERALRQFEHDRATTRRANELAQRGLLDFALDPIDARFRQRMRGADDLAIQPGGAEGAARARGAAVAERQFLFGQRFQTQAPVNPFETIAGQEAERQAREAAVVTEDAAEQARIAKFQAEAPESAFETTAGQEVERRARESKDLADEERANSAREEAVRLELQLLELGRQRTDLTRNQRDAMELSLSVQREQLQLADLAIQREREQLPEVQALIDKKKELVSAQESITRAVIEQQRLERTDPGAGAAAGLRDIEDIGAASGERMHQAFVSSFHDINRSFGDIVVDGLFNQGENAAEIGKQLGKRLVAGFVDQISSQLFARAFGAVGQAFGVTGAARPLATAVPTLTSPFAVAGAAGAGASAVAGVVEAGGGVVGSGYLADATGGASASAALATGPFVGRAAAASGGTATGVTLLGQGIGIAKEFGSGFFGTQLSAYGVLQAYQAGGIAGVAQAQALVGAGISETTASAIVAQEAIGLGAVEGGAAASTTAATGTTAAGIGATAASAAAGVLAAAALAYTAYSAYQSGDVVGGAIGGAVSGAVLGAAIGSAYPVVGTAIGLIAGAAIGAGAGALGKEEQEVKGDRLRNEADRQRRGAWIYQDLMNAINGGIDHEDIAQQSVRTGHSVGGLLLGVAASNQSGFLSKPPWGWAPSENARKTLEILTGMGYLPILDFQWDRLNSTAELIASWHNPRGVTEGDIEIARNAEALMAAFVNKQGQTVLIGYDESLSTGLRGSAGAVTRTTLLRSDRSREAAGQDIFVVGGSTRGLDDAQLIRLMNRMVKLDRDGDLKILEIESDNGATVTTGNWSV